jgi:hypothetical protein
MPFMWDSADEDRPGNLADVAAPIVEKGYQVENTDWWALSDPVEDVPDLQWPRNISVFEKMRRSDSAVQQVLRAVTLPVRRTPWRIDPNGADQEVVEFVADNLGLPILGQPARPVTRTRDRFDFGAHLRLALLALPFGASFFEQTYRIERVGNARRAHIRKLAWRPPRTIKAVNVASDGGLESIEQWSPGRGPDPKIPVSQLVAYVNEREGGNWLGQSLLRPAYKNWIIKDRLLRVQAQTVDRNGMGFPVYTASKQDERLSSEDIIKRSKAELTAGRQVAKSLRSGDNAGASVPNGAKVELLAPNGQLPDADKPIRYHDEQIGRAVLANFLSLGGDNSTGSYALGDTFQDFFTMSLAAIASDFADTTTMHVIEDLVDLNWGTEVRAPRLAFDEIGSKHPVTGEAIRALVECGAIRADDGLENHLRTIYDLPPFDAETARALPTTAGTNTSQENAA